MSFIDSVNNFKNSISANQSSQVKDIEEDDYIIEMTTSNEKQQEEKDSFLSSALEFFDSFAEHTVWVFEDIIEDAKKIFGLDKKTIEGSENNVNGEIDTKVKQGTVGDCILIGTVYSLVQNEAGKELIKDAITVNKNFLGITESYSVHFKGIDETFTITKKELQKADDLSARYRKDDDVDYTYSAGDDDMLLLELAWEKCCNEASDKLDNMYTHIIYFAGPEYKGPEALNGVHEQKFFYALTGCEFGRDDSIENEIARMQAKKEAPKVLEIFENQKEFKLEDVSNHVGYKFIRDGKTFEFNQDDVYEIVQKPSESEKGEIIIKNKRTEETFNYDARNLAETLSTKLSEKNQNTVFEGEYNLAIRSDIVTVNTEYSNKKQTFDIKTVDGEEKAIFTGHCYGVKDINDEYIILVNPHDTSEEIKISKEELKKHREKISFSTGNLE